MIWIVYQITHYEEGKKGEIKIMGFADDKSQAVDRLYKLIDARNIDNPIELLLDDDLNYEVSTLIHHTLYGRFVKVGFKAMEVSTATALNQILIYVLGME